MTAVGRPRGLFDEEPLPQPAATHPGTRENPFTISALTTIARGLLEDRFPSIWLVGEVSNFNQRSAGHWYFTLKDSHGELPVVMFSRENRVVRFEPRDGLEVLARGKLTIYPARGKCQLVLEEMTPRREGALALAFRQLEERLRREGLFLPERRRAIPLLPLAIGIVTSRDGAALRDILRVLRDRFAAVRVVLRDARVQGDGAAESLVAAIRELNDYGGLDVLIVGRGGGSIEDLWAFNEEAVVRAIAASRIPVISAVGHEIDTTLSDLVADLRAATPSAAAEKVIASRRELSAKLSRLARALAVAARLEVERRRRRLEVLARSRAFLAGGLRVRDDRQRLDDLQHSARRAVVGRIALSRQRLSRLSGRLSPSSLRERLDRRGERLGALGRRLARSGLGRIDSARGEVGRLAGLLDSLSPLAVLERGYAICFDASGTAILRDAAKVPAGNDVRVRLRRGRLDCRVTRCVSEDTEEP